MPLPIETLEKMAVKDFRDNPRTLKRVRRWQRKLWRAGR